MNDSMGEKADMMWKMIVICLTLAMTMTNGSILVNANPHGLESRTAETELETWTEQTDSISSQELIEATSEKSGQQALIYTYPIDLSAEVSTEGHETWNLSYNDDWGGYIPLYHGDWASVSELTHFWDDQGYYNIIYSDDTYIYVERYDSEMHKYDNVRITKEYPLLGDAIRDELGNLYVIWGKNNTNHIEDTETIIVTKYDSSGNTIAQCPFKSVGIAQDTFQTMEPFHGGNCSTIISNGILVCSYARQMYNGHQSNDLIAVNIADMSQNFDYYSYSSHSFDQRVFKDDNGVVYNVDHGDAYPRAFALTSSDGKYSNYEMFHFFGGTGDNTTNAWLGNMLPMKEGLVLIASSAKGMDETYNSQPQNLFMQLLGDGTVLKGASSRTGTCEGYECTDDNILWLTDYGKGTDVENPQAVKIDDQKIAILWEKYEDNQFAGSYYMIVSSRGDIIQDITSMGNTYLTAFEQPVYKDGAIYWTTAGRWEYFSENSKLQYHLTNGRRGIIYKLVVGQYKVPFIDVDTSSWFYDYVDYVYKHNIMTGMNAQEFGPANVLSRAQFATILYRMEGAPVVSYSPLFPDVPEGQFYSNAVIWANKVGVVQGYADGRFGTVDNITREQMAVMMCRYAKYKGYDLSETNDLKSFPDEGSVSSVARSQMMWAVGAGLISGSQGKIDPQGSASRAQCATIIQRFMIHYNG